LKIKINVNVKGGFAADRFWMPGIGLFFDLKASVAARFAS